MTPARYERLCQLFDQVQPLTPAERAAFLGAACADDPPLRGEVESLLVQDQQAGAEQLFRQPCRVNAKRLLAPADTATVEGTGREAGPDDALLGRRLGPYLVQQRLASGGMGTVYRALREDDYRQQVAVKVMQPGRDAAEMLHRFRTERQVLAELPHAHIARLLDGGTTDDGRPYFVMEYIDGEPLDRYCDGRGLGTRERVELLRSVCLAVQYAHEHGVLHRDLKPANVLVTADGTVKVTDFGLAKRLEGAPGGGDTPGGPTQAGVVLGTPSYMAPEQAAGKPADVGAAADVYALGAILYELLTGRPPFRGETVWDTVHQVLHEQPVAPSRLHPGLARDLETVCLKCLHKDPSQRYAGAAALADDLRRFLAGEPVVARPAGRRERLWRWCRRNPRVALLAGTVSALLVLVAVVSTGAAWWIATERDRADANYRTAEARRVEARASLERACQAVNEMLTRIGQEELRNQPGLDHVCEDVLGKALAFYQDLLQENGRDPMLRLETARAYGRVGQVYQMLGKGDLANARFHKAVDFLAELSNEFPDRPDYQHELATAHNDLAAFLLTVAGNRQEAEQAVHRALEILQRSAADDDGKVGHLYQLSRCHNFLGIIRRESRQYAQALPHVKKTIDLNTRLVEKDPRRPEYQLGLAMSYNNRAVTQRDMGPSHWKDALADWGTAIQVQAKLVDDFPKQPLYWKNLALFCQNRGALWMSLTSMAEAKNDPVMSLTMAAEAKKDLEQSLDLRKKLVKDYPARPDYWFDLSGSYNTLSNALKRTDGPERAREACREAVQIRTGLVNEYPRPDFKSALADSHSNLGLLLTAMRDWDGAEAQLNRALQIRRELAERFPKRPEHQGNVGRAHWALGELFKAAGDSDKAKIAFRQAAAVLAPLATDQMPSYQSDLAYVLGHLGMLLRDPQELPEARRYSEKAVRLHQRVLQVRPGDESIRQKLRENYGCSVEVLVRLGKAEAATKTAAALAQEPPAGWEEAYSAAASLARCIPLVEKAPSLPDDQRSECARTFGDQALALLRQAVARGLPGGAGVRKDEALAPLRMREDFQQLLGELENKGQAGPP
jgi:tetratricopeptide (TPR) repeat protein